MIGYHKCCVIDQSKMQLERQAKIKLTTAIVARQGDLRIAVIIERFRHPLALRQISLGADATYTGYQNGFIIINDVIGIIGLVFVGRRLIPELSTGYGRLVDPPPVATVVPVAHVTPSAVVQYADNPAAFLSV